MMLQRARLLPGLVLLGLVVLPGAFLACTSEMEPTPTPTPTPPGEGPDDGWSWRAAFDASELGALSSVWGSSPTDVFVVGGTFDQAEIYHFDGATWRTMMAPDVPLLVWVFGFGPNDVYAVGVGGGFAHYDGQAWSEHDSGTTQDLWGIWGKTPTDMWIVGGTVGEGEPVLLHYDGTTLTPEAVPANDLGATALFKIWGIGERVLAVGANGLIIERTNGAWQQVIAGAAANEDFVSLWGTSESNIVVVGGRTNAQIAHFDGTAWNAFKPIGTPGLNGCFMDRPDQAIVGGGVGYVGRFNPATEALVEEDAPAEDDIHAVWGDGAGRYYAVGGQFRPPFRGVALVRSQEETGDATRPIPAAVDCTLDADCTDGSACTVDMCSDGVCVFEPLDCSDGDACTIDACNAGVCTHVGLDCSDGNACTTDVCSSGVCVHRNACPAGQACVAGACVAATGCSIDADCADADPCTTDACSAGQCVNTPRVCSDGDACTIDECVSGACVFTPMSCNDFDACTEDACVNGVCQSVPRDCDDQDPCTIDDCAGGACTHVDIPGCACSAQTDCPLGDDCVGGACVSAVGPDLEIGLGGAADRCVPAGYARVLDGGVFPICEGFQGYTDVLPDVRVTGFAPGENVQVRGRLAFPELVACTPPANGCAAGQSCNRLNPADATGVCGPLDAQRVASGNLVDLGGGVGQFVDLNLIIRQAYVLSDGVDVVLTVQVAKTGDEATHTAPLSLHLTLEGRKICLAQEECPSGSTCTSNYCIP